MKKILSFLLIIILLFHFNSCNVNNKIINYNLYNNLYTTSSLQKIYTLNDKYVSVEKNAENVWEIINYNENFERSDFMTISEMFEICHISDNNQGGIYVSGFCKNDNTLHFIINEYDESGIKLREINEKNIDFVNSGDNLFLFYKNNDKYILILDKGVYILDNEFNIINSRVNGEIIYSCNGKDKNEIYLLYQKETGEKRIQKYNISSDNIEWDIYFPWLTNVEEIVYDNINSLLVLLESYTFRYLQNETGDLVKTEKINDCIYKKNSNDYINYNKEKIKIAKTISGEMFFYTLLLNSPDDESKIYMPQTVSEIEYNSNKMELENNQKDDITIKVYSSVPLFEYEKIIQQFYEKNGINVIFECYNENPFLTTQQSQDFQQKINASILSGTADWDILLNKDLDFLKYINDNVFCDLYSISGGEELKDTNKYYTNIFQACSVNDGELYLYPVDLRFHAMLLRNDIYEKYIPDINLESISYDTILNEIRPKMPASVAIIQKNGIFDNQIATIKSLMQTKVLGVLSNMMATGMQKNEIMDYIREYYLCIEKFNDKNLYGDSEEGLFIYDNISLSTLQGHMINYDNLSIIPIPTYKEEKSGINISITEGYLIMENSENKEKALMFLNFMADDGGISLYKTSPSKDAVKRNIEYAIETEKNMLFQKKKYFDENLLWEYTDLLNNITSINIIEANIYNYLYETTEKYLDNLPDLDKASNSLYDKLWIYYNE